MDSVVQLSEYLWFWDSVPLIITTDLQCLKWHSHRWPDKFLSLFWLNRTEKANLIFKNTNNTSYSITSCQVKFNLTVEKGDSNIYDTMHGGLGASLVDLCSSVAILSKYVYSAAGNTSY